MSASPSNYLIVINDAPYGNERPNNALRLALNLVKRPDTSVRVFLMGGSVNCAVNGQKIPYPAARARLRSGLFVV